MAAEVPLGHVQRIDAPHPDAVALTVRIERQNSVLVLRADGGLQNLPDRPRGAPADAFVMRLRKLVAGGVLLAIEAREGRHRLRLGARGKPCVLVAEQGQLRLRTWPDGKPLAGRGRFTTRALEEWPAVTLPPQSDAPGDTETEDRDAAQLLRRASAARKKLARKLAKIEADAKRADRCEALRHEADLLMANLATWPEGASRHEVDDWASGGRVVLELPPGMRPADHAAALYARAKRFARGRPLAEARAAAVREELATLDADIAAAREGDLEPLTARFAQVPTGARDGKRARRDETRRPDRVFLGHADRVIRVGRSARDNDALTQSARPHDLWLHARGVAGSHVIVPLAKNEDCPPELLADAAMLAAHFSKLAREPKVEVQYCRRHRVRKAKGMAPGAVLVRDERVMLVDKRPERIRWLLARERS